MELRSFNDLSKNDVNLFDITEERFKLPNRYDVKTYIIQKYEEFRMDIISERLYNTPDQMDLLLFINNITSPYQLYEGREIQYPIDNLSAFYITVDNNEEVQEVFLNKSKTTRKDKNRKTVLENKRVALPPTINEKKIDQVTVEGDSVIIGKGIFNS
jgi:hypothetical protein